MPFKFYHGRTGRVFNVNPNSIGVIVNKLIRNRIIHKRIHVRLEHLKKSTCLQDLKQRVKKNEEIKKAKKELGFEYKYSLEEGLLRLIAWRQKQI